MAGAAAAVSGEPQSPQKRWPGGFVPPHDSQTAARALPHEPQNRWPSGFSAPQFAQGLIAHSVERAWRLYHLQLRQTVAASRSISGAYMPVRAAPFILARW